MGAIYEGHTELAKMIINKGANLDFVNEVSSPWRLSSDLPFVIFDSCGVCMLLLLFDIFVSNPAVLCRMASRL